MAAGGPAERDGQRFLDAVANARLVSNAERYYRTMYFGARDSCRKGTARLS